MALWQWAALLLNLSLCPRVLEGDWNRVGQEAGI